MNVAGFIGASGTGKSYHALAVAEELHISCMIDDGLLIYENRLIAGTSAKEETNRMKAVRRAVFHDKAHAAAVKAALARIQPDRILILGTSRHMVHRICQALELPEAEWFISIEDVSSPEEIERARSIRINEGKHIIPVPVIELKPHFRGHLLAPVKAFLRGRGDRNGGVEHSVVRPVFSYYGKLVIANEGLEHLVRHCLCRISGIAAVHRLDVAGYCEAGGNGLSVSLALSVYAGEPAPRVMTAVKKELQRDIEYTAGMSVDELKITVRSVVPPRKK